MKKTKKAKNKKYLIVIILLCAAVFLISKYLGSQNSDLPILPTVSSDDPFFIGDMKGMGLEIPQRVDNHQIISHTGYTLSYNEEYEVADWVAYEFTNQELNTSVASRNENFRADDDVKTGSAELSDYKYSGYSRGHLAPAADFKWSEDAMNDTFYLSNMTPQLQNNFNAGIWLSAENLVRDICSQSDVVYVATGPVLTDGPYETIGKNKVAIPKNFYKVLIWVDETGHCKSMGMLIPHNADRKDDIKMYFCTVNDVEDVTGLDFFPLLSDEIEEIIEGSTDYFM